jgi:uncharacterized protein
MDPFEHVVRTETELREIYAPPTGLAAVKEIDHLDDAACELIACSSLVFLATHDATGRCDVTPRGGPPGFVRVIDGGRLAIPDATGNRRIDSLRNVVETGQAGLIFLVPGRSWTLRVNGAACVTTEPSLLEALPPVGKPPRTAIVVEPREVFTHCPKAFVRSRAWDPESWLPADEQPAPAEVLHAHVGDPQLTVAAIEESLAESLRSRLD